jgi:pimeloyl-ACP methyl ester carboxylesterase
MWPIPDRGLRRRLPHLTVPTLVLHGESDGLVPVAYAQELASRIPDAKLVTIPGAGHLPMIEAEDAFVSAVTAFLD